MLHTVLSCLIASVYQSHPCLIQTDKADLVSDFYSRFQIRLVRFINTEKILYAIFLEYAFFIYHLSSG